MSNELNEKAVPELSPSGQKPKLYAEVLIKVWCVGPDEDVFEGAEAVVETAPGLPFECLVIAAEHLVTAVAMKSNAGFERALELVVEGAMTNKGQIIEEEEK